MRTIQYAVYTIDEHPNPESCFDWIKDNWHDLAQHDVEEMVDSLKALASAIDGELRYSISAVPDRGEYVSITDYDEDLLHELWLIRDECPLTGMCYDINVIGGLFIGELESSILNTVHNQADYRYSDEALREMCECNEHEFTEDGEFV